MKKLRVGFLCLLCALLSVLPVCALDAAPTETFTRQEVSGTEKTVATRPVYTVDKVITPRSLGMQEDMGKVADIDCDPTGQLYVMTAKSHVFRVDPDTQAWAELPIVTAAGEPLDFADAKGIYAPDEHELYIADTMHARVLYCRDGVLQEEITLPESDLIPEDFLFNPAKVTRDSEHFLYVVSEGSYYGALLYDPNGEFVGFYGANTVSGNVLTTLSYIWDLLTQNDEKRSRSVKTLPYDFSDICVDDDNFIYTCTGVNGDGDVGQLRMLSPGGTNILVGSESNNFGERTRIVRLGIVTRQNFSGVATDSEGLIYALDKAYGLIYVYDTDSNLMAAFGGGRGSGAQVGTFAVPCSMALFGNRLMIADTQRNSVTVYTLTEYGDLLFRAQKMTLKADYIGAKPLWEQVLQQDGFNRLAILGLAKAAYAQEDYDTAMRYAKQIGDREVYSRAMTNVHSAYITEHFAVLFLLALLVVGGLTALVIVSIKRHIVIIRHEKLRTAVSCMVHPFARFYDIKFKNGGSMAIAIIWTVLFYVTSVLAVTESDFRYTSFDASTYNSLMQIVQTVGLILLWSLANWAVCTLAQGKGRFKEVYLVTAYSVLPLIIYNLVSIPLSHLISSADSTLMAGLHGLALIFTGIMLCVGLMVIHDFTFPRFLFTGVITVLFMILVVFIVFMIGILLTQFGGFFWSILMEALQ